MTSAIKWAKPSEPKSVGVSLSMTKIWMTRTRPAADESAKAWRKAGFDPIVEPLLAIASVDHDPLPRDATAEHARKAGFSDVVSVDGTSKDVTRWVLANCPVSQPVCHVSGWHVRGTIIEDLSQAGYDATRVKVYRSIPRPVWPKTQASLVALYSPLAAQVFAGLCEGASLSGVSAICISQATAKALEGLNLKSIHIANRPREDELIMAAKSV